MKNQTAIYYYSATGNSLWVAKQLQSQILDCDLISIISHLNQEKKDDDYKFVGLIFPTHKLGLPNIVKEFLQVVHFSKDSYIFAVVTGGKPAFGASFHQIRCLLKKQNIKLYAGYHLKMPATYFSFFSQKKYSDKFIYSDDLKLKLQKISAVIKNRENHRECGLGLLSLINRLKVRKDNEPNKKFHIDEGCIRCGYCVMVCPMKNIRIVNSKIIFSNNCNTCFACVHYCSQGVLQYGNRTEGKQRYRHPSISIGDLMVQKR